MASNEHGFTLVEVLVALLIMAVLSTMAWQGVDGISRTREASQAQMERTLRLNTIIAQWEQDLLALYDTTAVRPLHFDGANVRLARLAEGGVQVVVWSLKGNQWRRWAGPVVTRVIDLQDSWMLSQQLLGNEPGQLLLLEGVSELQVEFSLGQGWFNSQSTGELVSASAGTGAGAPRRERLPDGVKLVLSLDNQKLTRIVRLAPQFPS
jgi:general secretion pathway protein J